jgi:hypothetical protein
MRECYAVANAFTIRRVQEKGRGFWKINNSILQELKYQTLINHLIDKHIENSKNNQIDLLVPPLLFPDRLFLILFLKD